MNSERGDTLVEVLVAIALLGVVIAAAMRMMTVGQAAILNNVERTQVQSQMTSQLNMIRYARDEYFRAERQPMSPGARDWMGIMNYVSPELINPDGCSQAREGFWLDTARFDGAAEDQVAVRPYGQSVPETVATPGDGLWVEARRQGNENYVDFVIKSCWSTSNSNGQQEAKTAMRLYVP